MFSKDDGILETMEDSFICNRLGNSCPKKRSGQSLGKIAIQTVKLLSEERKDPIHHDLYQEETANVWV